MRLVSQLQLESKAKEFAEWLFANEPEVYRAKKAKHDEAVAKEKGEPATKKPKPNGGGSSSSSKSEEKKKSEDTFGMELRGMSGVKG